MADLRYKTQSSGLNKVIQTSGPATPVSQPKRANSQFGGFSGGGDFQGTGGGATWGDAEPVVVAPVKKAAPTAAEKERGGLRNEITARVQEILAAYEQMFGGLDNLLRDRARTTEDEYGGQLSKTTKQYADSLPMIQASYAALGADSSTDNRDAGIKAKEGFDETVGTINKNKAADLSKIGQFGTEQKAKWAADKDSVARLGGRVGSVEDTGELRQARNDVESKLGSVRADLGTLDTDAGARSKLSSLTGDNGRYDSIVNSLDNIIKGSLAGSVKQAAVQTVVDNAGLNEAEKKKVQALYGNTYAEQAAL